MNNNQRQKMPVLSQAETSFNEVALGYDELTAQTEAARCLNCKNKPCMKGCPVGINIPGFIHKIKEKDYSAAYKIITESSLFPAICGRVCPQETQCEKNCIRAKNDSAVAIGNLERFVADWHRKNNSKSVKKPDFNGHKIAVIGSGPAGLSCSGELVKKGYSVTVFEALHIPGGVLEYGIPEFRLPKAIVQDEISNLKNLGVKFELNTVIGKTLTVRDLFSDGFERIFIATGAGAPRFMGIFGENLNGVFSANEFLTRINLMKSFKKNSSTPLWHTDNITVIGGGNVAMDAARCAKRLGAKTVKIVYRRTEKEIPARLAEIEHAKKEGIELLLLTNPVKILGDSSNRVNAIECVKMQLTTPDSDGRQKVEPIDNSNFIVNTDCVIIAIGTHPNPIIKNSLPELNINSKGGIIINPETGLTSVANVYSGGDIVTGAATVIQAMGAGKKAALAIDESFKTSKMV